MMKIAGWTTPVLVACLAMAGCESADSRDDDGVGRAGGELGKGEEASNSAANGGQSGKPASSAGATDTKKPASKPLPVNGPTAAPTTPAGPDAPDESAVPRETDGGSSGSSIGCANVRCRAGTTCVEHASGPACEPTAAGTCAATLCAVNTDCVEGPKGAECVPRVSGGGSCLAALCAANTQCIDGPNGAMCVPLGSTCTAKCSAGQRCELIHPPCAPTAVSCPAQPTCVPERPEVVDACATVRCKAGTHCESKRVQCIRAPCPPVAACVAD